MEVGGVVHIELKEEYLQGAVGRFKRVRSSTPVLFPVASAETAYFKVFRPGLMWNGSGDAPLDASGGVKRPG